MTEIIAAKIYALFTLAVIAFQIALAAGAPWGQLAMGGKFPGVYPKKMRIVALLMCVFLFLLAAIVSIRAGWFYPELRSMMRQLVWAVVMINAIGFLMNMITPSRWERIIWAPVTFILLVCSVFIGLS